MENYSNNDTKPFASTLCFSYCLPAFWKINKNVVHATILLLNSLCVTEVTSVVQNWFMFYHDVFIQKKSFIVSQEHVHNKYDEIFITTLNYYYEIVFNIWNGVSIYPILIGYKKKFIKERRILLDFLLLGPKYLKLRLTNNHRQTIFWLIFLATF